MVVPCSGMAVAVAVPPTSLIPTMLKIAAGLVARAVTVTLPPLTATSPVTPAAASTSPAAALAAAGLAVNPAGVADRSDVSSRASAPALAACWATSAARPCAANAAPPSSTKPANANIATVVINR